jgi:Tfp pilus assembly protein PilV
MKKNLNKKGIILIEAILALGMIVVIMTALVTALVSSLSNTNFSKNESIATNYAQEGLEIARNDKDFDFTQFSGMSGTYCLYSDEDNPIQSVFSAPTSPPCSKIDGIFTRTIYINNSGNDSRPGADLSKNPRCLRKASNQPVYVASTVTWADSKCSGSDQCHKVELNSCFINLNNLQ